VALSLGVKRPVREADQSPPYIAEVKNGGVIPPLFHMSSWRDLYHRRSSMFIDLNRNMFNERKISESLPYPVLTKSVEGFWDTWKISIYDFMHIKIYYGSMWL
jgi:hypothetical protein